MVCPLGEVWAMAGISTKMIDRHSESGANQACDSVVSASEISQVSSTKSGHIIASNSP